MWLHERVTVSFEADENIWKLSRWDVCMTPDCTKCHRIVHLKMVSFLLCEWGWKSLSCIWLFVTPQTIQSMEFFRPEYWRGYLFPSLGDLPNPGIEPRSPALQVDSSPAEPQGKPKNTGVGSLSLLQQTFLTQKLNPGFLNSRQILYQLSSQLYEFHLN